MKFILLLPVLCCIFLSCNNKESRPATALDTGREFIRATLDGKLDEASQLLSDDSLNKKIFESYKDFYKRLPAEQKKSYKNASYNINSYKDLNDSVTIINYSNDYMNKPMDIKVIRKNAAWGVDFAYTSGDTTGIQ